MRRLLPTFGDSNLEVGDFLSHFGEHCSPMRCRTIVLSDDRDNQQQTEFPRQKMVALAKGKFDRHCKMVVGPSQGSGTIAWGMLSI